MQNQSVSFLKDIIAQTFGVRVAVFICGGAILDANDDKMTVCQHPRLTDGARVFLHKVPCSCEATGSKDEHRVLHSTGMLITDFFSICLFCLQAVNLMLCMCVCVCFCKH